MCTKLLSSPFIREEFPGKIVKEWGDQHRAKGAKEGGNRKQSSAWSSRSLWNTNHTKGLVPPEGKGARLSPAYILQLLATGCTKGLSTSKYLCGPQSASSPRAVLWRRPVVPTVGNQSIQSLRREYPEPVIGGREYWEQPRQKTWQSTLPYYSL